MRRLPIYFLIDVSESMIGEPIEQVQDGIAEIIKALKADPYALETVWLSIIGFAGKSKVITPLQDVISFYPPKIPIGSGTSLSDGLIELMNAIDNDVVRTTYESKGDWKPVIFLFTDGIPTDSVDIAFANWNNKYRSRTNLVAISIGENTNYNLLGQITDHVLQFNNTSVNCYKDFFKWVTASIKATSEKVTNNNSSELDLTKVEPSLVKKIDLTKIHRLPDENYVILNGKCSKSQKMYLVKFKKSIEDSIFSGLKTRVFTTEGAYKIDEKSYKDFSKENDYLLKISSDELSGNPGCPCCGNQFSIAHCICGGIHCISLDGLQTCPWCGNSDYYGTGEGGFDINRTLG